MKALRGRIEAVISLEDLRTAWGLVNLENHTWSLSRPSLDLMLVIGNDGKIALPEKTERIIEILTKCGYPPEVLRLNCGHSSVGIFPYNIIAARKVLRFLKETPTLAELWEARGLRWDFSEGPPRRKELAPGSWKDRKN